MINISDKDNNEFDEFDDFEDFEDFDASEDLGDGNASRIEDLPVEEDTLEGGRSEDFDDFDDDLGSTDDWDDFDDEPAAGTTTAQATEKKARVSKKTPLNPVVLGAAGAVILLGGGAYFLMQPASQPTMPPPAALEGGNDSAGEVATLPAPSPISNFGEVVEEEFVPDYQNTLEDELLASSRPPQDDMFYTADELRQDTAEHEDVDTGERQFLTPDPELLPEQDQAPLEPLEPVDAAEEFANVDEPPAAAKFDLGDDLKSSADFQRQVDINEPVEELDPVQNSPDITDPVSEEIAEPASDILNETDGAALEPDVAQISEDDINLSAQNDVDIIEPVSSQNSTMPEQDSGEIEKLRTDLAEANTTIDTLNGTVSSLESEVGSLKDQIESLKAQVAQAEKMTEPSPAKSNSEPVSASKPKNLITPDQKPVTTEKKAPAPAPAKVLASPVRASEIWALRSAQPGSAVLYNKKTSDVMNVEVGSTIRGLGKISFIGIESGKWIVKGSQGFVEQ